MNRRIEIAFVVIMFLIGCAFLRKMCYLSLAFNTVFIVGFLSVVYFYLRLCYRLLVPLSLLMFVFLAVQVDALGNFFRMYGEEFGPMQYDEFSHLSVQVLVTPLLIWLSQNAFTRFGYKLSLKLTAVIAGAIMFSLASFYEIIELWDELYFGGHRIWGSYDTATDLQWDLCGIIVGSLLAYVVLSKPVVLQLRHESG